MHPIVRPEEMSGECHDGAVRRMIQRFEPGYPACERGVVVLHVFDELVLRARRAHDENRARIRQRPVNMPVELVIGRCVSGVSRIRLVMQMLIRVGAGDGLGVVQLGVEIQDPGLPMIDPNDAMKVFAHEVTIAQGKYNQQVTCDYVRYRTQFRQSTLPHKVTDAGFFS